MWLLALSGRLKLGFFSVLKKSRGQLTKTRVTLDGPSKGTGWYVSTLLLKCCGQGLPESCSPRPQARHQ